MTEKPWDFPKEELLGECIAGRYLKESEQVVCEECGSLIKPGESVITVTDIVEGEYISLCVKCTMGAENIKAKVEKIVKWAKNKYGNEALYFLEETHEGREVWGDELTKRAATEIRRQMGLV